MIAFNYTEKFQPERGVRLHVDLRRAPEVPRSSPKETYEPHKMYIVVLFQNLSKSFSKSEEKSFLFGLASLPILSRCSELHAYHGILESKARRRQLSGQKLMASPYENYYFWLECIASVLGFSD